MNKNILAIIAAVFYWNPLFAQSGFAIERIDPPNWWVGMKDSTLQLCVYGKSIATAEVALNYPGVKIVNKIKVENPDYLFIDLVIGPEAKPGDVMLNFYTDKNQLLRSYSLQSKSKCTSCFQGFDSRDFIYQVMPDRFANGDPRNDIVKYMGEKEIHRDSIFSRHGGDLKGIMNHLDYIKSLGATVIWLTPVLENNQLRTSYHGYSITDHYNIDPRYGNNQLYADFVKEAHAKGMKVLMDMVYNHVGNEHWFYKNPPSPDWIHRSDSFVNTNYRVTALMDPHASKSDKYKMSDGWFVPSMPDLNQRNPLLARYLIQNSIWWIEYAGIDGFRFDTYAYSDTKFMSNLMAAVKNEFPEFSAVGELWDHAVAFQAWYMQHSKIEGAPESNLPGLTDFQLYFALTEALNKPMDWTDGLTKIYYTLAEDFLYSDPDRNMVFVDNHDLSRFYSVVGGDLRKFKMGIGFLLTTRGIPCMYYGTEILMTNFADPDGKVRSDFPGGWPEDKTNKFKATGRTKDENEAFDFITNLAHIRLQNAALQTGKLTQFVPEKDTYVYFRNNDTSAFMIVMHYGEKSQNLSLARFSEGLTGYSKGKDVLSGDVVSFKKPLILQPFSIRIVQLRK